MAYSPESRAMRPAPIPTKEVKPFKKRIPEPFDPEELSRRLRTVQAEQKAKAERKRRGEVGKKPKGNVEAQGCVQASDTDEMNRTHLCPRSTEVLMETNDALNSRSRAPFSAGIADYEEESSSKYRHIPQVAALQFARTTTTDNPEERTLVHKLSRMAMGFHMDGINAGLELPADSSNGTPREKAMALREAQIERGKQYKRNQFQHSSALTSTSTNDRKTSRLSHRHTFETHVWPKGPLENEDNSMKRLSVDSAIQVRMSLEKMVLKQRLLNIVWTGRKAMNPNPM